MLAMQSNDLFGKNMGCNERHGFYCGCFETLPFSLYTHTFHIYVDLYLVPFSCMLKVISHILIEFRNLFFLLLLLISLFFSFSFTFKLFLPSFYSEFATNSSPVRRSPFHIQSIDFNLCVWRITKSQRKYIFSKLCIIAFSGAAAAIARRKK